MRLKMIYSPMAKYSEKTIADVNAKADIRDFIPGADPAKTKQTITCPFCGEKKKFGITHNSKWNSASCYVCKQGFSGPISAHMHYQGYGKDKYRQAIEEVAKQAGMVIYSDEDQARNAISETSEKLGKSFCAQQMRQSGLKVEDVMATVEGEDMIQSPFIPGSVRAGWKIDPLGSDMIIRYYDLHGRPLKFIRKGQKTPQDYFRVRHLNPDLHQVDGKAMKYQSPAGSTTPAYIPEKVRRLFKAKEHIETLYLQEGEKKAEKACKHGMISIGIQGINNIGTADAGLLQDIQDVVMACKVRNVVLMMDSDWNNLSRDLTVGSRVDKRPNSFAAAVIKFKNLMACFHNLKIDVEAWWGHVNDNPAGDKGVDDLLTGTLKDRESLLIEDAEKAMHTPQGAGEYVTIKKISTMTDMRIRDIWALNDDQEFFNRHREQLAGLETFRLGRVRYKVADGQMVVQSKYKSEGEIYNTEINELGETKKVGLNYTELFQFLEASGFFRLKDSTEEAAGFQLIHIDDGIIERISPYEVRDFVRDYVMKNTRDVKVKEYFMSRLDTALSDKKLEALPITSDDFNVAEPNLQRTSYNNGTVEITPDNIRPGQPINNVWRSAIVPRAFSREPIFRRVDKAGDGIFEVEYTEQGRRCEFLRYLVNTSNNYYAPGAERELTEEEEREWAQHLVNKLTAIGYMLCAWKPASERKAVVIQDHLMSEVGQNQGGAGKSLIGVAVSKIIPQTFISGMSISKNDQFLLSQVTRATRNLFIDDVRPNFNFKDFYPIITGDMEVNPKHGQRFSIPADKSPKILITTNHTINSASENATRRRIVYMEFSTWYNPEHTPVDDFGHLMFDDWDAEQWTLYDNLMAECVQLYLRSMTEGWAQQGTGVVPAPMRQIELRTLRQEMSEVFYQWAEEYYDITGEHLNVREKRPDIYQNFIEYAGTSGHGVTTSNIGRKIRAYCKFKGYHFNINKDCNGRNFMEWQTTNPHDIYFGDQDKSGGKEYFTLTPPEMAPTTKITPIPDSIF